MVKTIQTMIRLTIRFALLLLFSTPASAQLQQGLISGTVLAPDGNPVEDAHVSAQVMKGSAVLTVLNADTGKDGQFTFSGLALGEYRLSAQKIEAGYLSTGTDVLGGGKPLAIALTAEMPTSTALIHLGPKAAIITGWVLDSSTGSAISAKLSLRPMDGSSWSMTGIDQKFKFRVLVPANTAIRLGACADGYSPWFYADPSMPTRPTPVQLASGVALDIVIRLEPAKDRAEMSCAAGTF